MPGILYCELSLEVVLMLIELFGLKGSYSTCCGPEQLDGLSSFNSSEVVRESVDEDELDFLP